jgi:hypothetical protein
MEVQRALGRQGISVEEALQATDSEDERTHTDSNITSLDMSAKTPRKGPPA